MIETERERLKARESEYLSIGITEGGVPLMAIGVPWEATSHAYNMRTPNVYISPEDLLDEEIMALLASFKVIGCYIMTPLEDYSFISRFSHLQDISIRKGDSIRSLDFLLGLNECRMLYLQNARLKDLDVIVEVKRRSKVMFGAFRCVGLCNCEVEDISGLAGERLYFSEFLVWKPRGSNERERWKAVCAHTFRYFEYK